MKKKKLPVGIENFEEFQSSNFYFVDKSMYIAELLQNRGKVNLFTRGGTFVKSVRQELTYRDVDTDVDHVWSVLYSTGYLTGTHVEGMDAEVFRLRIPNGEIRKLFADLSREWFWQMNLVWQQQDEKSSRGQL